MFKRCAKALNSCVRRVGAFTTTASTGSSSISCEMWFLSLGFLAQRGHRHSWPQGLA
ncbi:hypothetical protein BDV27DRAFT_127714 [Aspergillus caelatus]|uniref:Uncharacterized protein n=1 Tax=Aspergillus caelatus TaxID=61420 RepID=A0A5N7A502_9EURO|nr:uncharacterized protein BDV27DRAFT_127714 [Aspergillus caelatus]KAE8364937.1 hypothetical protein BDV27DRAFT_127714 [Aspergillus caelatus]